MVLGFRVLPNLSEDLNSDPAPILGSLQMPIALALGDLMFSPGLCEHLHSCAYTQTHTHN